ncbi:MAG: hypothetical protein CBE33_01845 [Candidatus Pelagibacter sp. TMED273]|nr:MAG: hypothetical protein CBE33_01845 [Candidatus Pelagibacter sp. TMED273]
MIIELFLNHGVRNIIYFEIRKKLLLHILKLKKVLQHHFIVTQKKKTGFLILKGTAEVQIGIYKKNIKKYKPMSILVLRPGLFHRIKANKNSDLFALEIENPYLKNDLIRMQDNYGRKNKGYEKLKNTRALEKNDIIFKIPKISFKNKYKLNDIKIEISYYKNFKDLKSYDDKSISIILDGKVISHHKKTVITAGEIVKSYTLKQLVKDFKIDNKILLLKASKK